MRSAMIFQNSLRVLLRAVLVIISLTLTRSAAAQQPAYNTPFLTDQQFENYTSMTVEEIQAFLEQQHSYFRQPIKDVDGQEFDPSAVVAQAASQYRINPQVLLATLQKESTGVTRSTRPSDTTLCFLMGCVSSSTAREQLACAAERFRAYYDQLKQQGPTVSGWRVGVAKQTQDGVLVTPATRAVAAQFTYTPYAGAQWGGDQRGVGGVYLFYDAWQKFGFGAAVPSEVAASATVLLVDVSGSMGENWRGGVKIESAKNAATDVINMIEQESQVGESDHQVAVATFTNDAHLDLGLTTDYASARSVVAGLEPLNMTNIGAGLQVANQALASTPTTTQKIVILLSDGLTNEGLSPAEILAGPVQEAAAAGTCIYTVGFGEPGDLDETLLRQIAEGSGCGTYTYASTPAELEQIYIRLRHQALGQIIGEFEGQIAQGETADVGQVDVPRNQGELYITLNWPGSDLDLILTDPRGRPVDENYPGVSFVKYERLIYLIVENPSAGLWQLQAYGAEVTEGILDYAAIVSVRERTEPPPTNISMILLFVGLVVVMGLVIVLVVTQQQQRPRLAPAVVQVVSGQAVRPFVALRRKQLIIGRDSRCGMVLPGPQVSTRHAMIQQTPQGYVLTDLGSRNGTFVNGQRVQQALLRGGERLRIGRTELDFAIPGTGAVPVSPSQPPVGAATAYLAVMAGEQEFARYPVTPGTMLGRYTGCPVDLNADALVSHQHARLDYQAGQWIVTDLGSGNGTFVNGQQVRQQALRHGDELQVGNTRMRFYVA